MLPEKLQIGVDVVPTQLRNRLTLWSSPTSGLKNPRYYRLQVYYGKKDAQTKQPLYLLVMDWGSKSTHVELPQGNINANYHIARFPSSRGAVNAAAAKIRELVSDHKYTSTKDATLILGTEVEYNHAIHLWEHPISDYTNLAVQVGKGESPSLVVNPRRKRKLKFT